MLLWCSFWPPTSFVLLIFHVRLCQLAWCYSNGSWCALVVLLQLSLFVFAVLLLLFLLSLPLCCCLLWSVVDIVWQWLVLDVCFAFPIPPCLSSCIDSVYAIGRSVSRYSYHLSTNLLFHTRFFTMSPWGRKSLVHTCPLGHGPNKSEKLCWVEWLLKGTFTLIFESLDFKFVSPCPVITLCVSLVCQASCRAGCISGQYSSS